MLPGVTQTRRACSTSRFSTRKSNGWARRRCSRSTRSKVYAVRPDRLACDFEYATQLFELDTAQRLVSDYASVLATLAFDAHAYVGELRVSASHELMQGGDYTGLAVSEA